MGEYVPYFYIAVSHALGFHDTQSFTQIMQYRQHLPGKPPSPIETSSDAVLGILYCNESISPTLYQSLTAQGANVLVNSASHLWFNGSHTVYAQLKHAAQVRAVENGRWLVEAGNVAPAFIVDAYGRVIDESEWNAQGDVLRYDIPLLTHKTLYASFGLWVLLLPLFAVLTLVCMRCSRKE